MRPRERELEDQITILKRENERLRGLLEDQQRWLDALAKKHGVPLDIFNDAERWRKAKTLEPWRISKIISKHKNDGIDADAAIDAAMAQEGE